MNAKADRSYPIAELGLELTLPEAAEVIPSRREDGGGLHQELAGGPGFVFLRWGAGQSVDTLPDRLADFLTSVRVTSRGAARIAGGEGRRVEIELERGELAQYHDDESGPSHRSVPARSEIVVAVGFERAGIPVVIGYRLPKGAGRALRRAAEAFLRSARASEPEDP